MKSFHYLVETQMNTPNIDGKKKHSSSASTLIGPTPTHLNDYLYWDNFLNIPIVIWEKNTFFITKNLLYYTIM